VETAQVKTLPLQLPVFTLEVSSGREHIMSIDYTQTNR
jgi:hypothetical protein